MRKRIFGTVMWMIALALVLGLSPARAEVGLYVGPNYDYLGGGSIDVSRWMGQNLDFLYCLDYFDHVTPSTLYSATTATTSGTVTMTRTNSASVVNSGYVSGSTGATNAVAGEVAYLLDKYGISGQGTQAVELQEAIWGLIYGLPSSSNPIPSLDATALSYRTEALGAAPGNISSYLWFTPSTGSGDGVHQALVGRVPEPTSIVLLGAFFVVGLLGSGAKRKLA